MKNETQAFIEKLFTDSIIDTIKRVKLDKGNSRPFHSRLIGEEILKVSKFERSYSTSFGQKAIEQMSLALAKEVKGTSNASTQKKSNIRICKQDSDYIEAHLKSLKENTLGREPEWSLDCKILKRKSSNLELRIISDLWFNRNNIDYFFSIKTVKPNIDQSREAKRDLLSLLAHNKNCKPYFALPYNPYGDLKKDYAHTPPFSVFNFLEDECILIGEEYWDLIGGKGTYHQILDIAEQVGKKSKKLIDSM